MKTTVNFYTFRNAFQRMRPNNFSPSGLIILFDYLEQYEKDTGEELELDVIALCCEFSEMSADEIAKEYDVELDDVREYLHQATIVCGEYEDNGKTIFVFQQF